jgi:hypothetical protein
MDNIILDPSSNIFVVIDLKYASNMLKSKHCSYLVGKILKMKTDSTLKGELLR